MWDKFKGKAKYLIIVLMAFFLVIDVAFVHNGYGSKEESYLYVVFLAALFLLNWLLEMWVSVSLRKLNNSHSDLSSEMAKLQVNLIEQIESLWADNKTLLTENTRLNNDKITPIRTRKHD